MVVDDAALLLLPEDKRLGAAWELLDDPPGGRTIDAAVGGSVDAGAGPELPPEPDELDELEEDQ